MKLVAFTIHNFRSIVDTGWCPLSSDQITVLVGQNESGKTSVLQALHCLLDNDPISSDDVRADSPLPKMQARCEVEDGDLDELKSFLCAQQFNALSAHLKEHRNRLEFVCEWAKDVKGDNGYSCAQSMRDDALKSLLSVAWEAYESAQAKPTEATQTGDASAAAEAPPEAAPVATIEPPAIEASAAQTKPSEFTLDDLADFAYGSLPRSTLFNADSGLPPSVVEIGANRGGSACSGSCRSFLSGSLRG